MSHRRIAFLWVTLWTAGSALAAALLARQELDLSRSLARPQAGHWLGFDPLGRDLLGSLLRSSATSMGFAALTVGLCTVLALVGGIGIALAPRGPRYLLLRALDTLLAFPGLLLALGWAALRGPGWATLEVSLLLGILPSFTRLIFVRTRELLAEPYVLAARGLGANSGRLMRWHLAPSLRSLCGVKVPFLFAQSLMAEATLSFLGVGAPIGKPSWGALLAQGRDYLFEAPQLAIVAGLPLVLCVLALQALSSD